MAFARLNGRVSLEHWGAQMSKWAKLMSKWARTIEDAIVWDPQTPLGCTKIQLSSTRAHVESVPWAEQMDAWVKELLAWAGTVQGAAHGVGDVPRYAPGSEVDACNGTWREQLEIWAGEMSNWAQHVEQQVTWPRPC